MSDGCARGGQREKSEVLALINKWDQNWTRPFFFVIFAWCRTWMYKATLSIPPMSQRARHSITEAISSRSGLAVWRRAW